MNVIDALKDGPKSIPHLSKLCGIDEFDTMHEVAKLEDQGIAALKGFDRLYREDGGAIYLAKYALVKA